MCLFPKLIKNPKYLPNKKNGGIPPVCNDIRTLYVPIGCGKCIECRKQKAQQWRIRLSEELKVQKYAYYCTFTFSNAELRKLRKELHMRECNAVAGKALRRFLERWRKIHKKSLRHWFITELGHEGTERIHLHGIIFADFEITNDTFQEYWKYGFVRIGKYCNLKTINYIIKYVTKIDNDHKGFEGEIFCSAGIGSNYVKRYMVQEIHKFDNENTIEFYRATNGTKHNLPIYYRNKLFSEQEREQLWINKIQQRKRYVLGIEIDVSTEEGLQRYYRVLKKAQEKNKQLGFGDFSQEWKKRAYNITTRMLNQREKYIVSAGKP